MRIQCINHAYNIITGEKRFTRGAVYATKIARDTIYALDDKGEWTKVSALVGTDNLFENEIFKSHFKLVENSVVKLKAM